MISVNKALQRATVFLDQKGVDRPRFVAATLLADVLEIDRPHLYMQLDRLLKRVQRASFADAVRRAATFEPIAYIMGRVEFFGCPIRVGPGVLIPRHETEILLEHVESHLDGGERRALDLCTGSGCIAAALKTHHPHLEVTAVDQSPEALAWARENHAGIEWIEGDLLEPLKGRTFDLILCNPPYVSVQEYGRLEPSVRLFEPKMALVGGEEGIEFYKRLAKGLPEILTPNAKVFFEIGAGQGAAIRSLFADGRWGESKIVADWAGHDRFFILNL